MSKPYFPTGSLVALVTPFHADNRIHFDKLSQLVDYHLTHGTHGLVILGTTGESPTLSFDESQAIVKHVVAVADGRIPIIVGSGSNNTAQAITYSQTYEALGADYLMVLTPYYNRTNATGMVNHFTAIADSVNTGIIMYNVPSRTGCSLSIDAVETLAKHPHIIGLKEASGDMSYNMQASRYLSEDFALYTGNDDIIVPTLSLGGSGVISVWANIMPRQVSQLVSSYLAGDHATALKLQQTHLDFINHLFVETNPIPIKYALNHLGFELGTLRMPLDELGESYREKMHQLLNRFTFDPLR